jgi:IMP cyclohydrolase
VNPNGPYPGRQLFLGKTLDGKPCLAYLVTGRSPASRERKATPLDNGIIIGPIGNQPYDPLRHYTGIKYDNQSGVVAVSNGIQTDAIFEAYKLLFNTKGLPGKDFMEKLLEGAGAEPDSYHTPRIAGAITTGADGKPVLIIGIKRFDIPARTFQVEPEPGVLLGVSTYKGSMEKPEAYDPTAGPSKLEYHGNTARSLAERVFDMSEALYEGDDIRVCAVGGILGDDNHTWQIAAKNK